MIKKYDKLKWLPMLLGWLTELAKLRFNLALWIMINYQY